MLWPVGLYLFMGKTKRDDEDPLVLLKALETAAELQFPGHD